MQQRVVNQKFAIIKIRKITKTNIHAIIFIVLGYSKLLGKSCYPDRYGRFSTMQSAMAACSADGNCQGVYDKGCNVGANDIFLCPTSATYRDSSRSCIYQNNENGKYSKSFYISTY